MIRHIIRGAAVAGILTAGTSVVAYTWAGGPFLNIIYHMVGVTIFGAMLSYATTEREGEG